MKLKGRQHRSRVTAAAESRPERSTTFVQPQVTPPCDWTMSRVNAALSLHEIGDFSESALLVDAMGRDDRIDACLNTRVNAIAGKNGVDFAIVPPEKGDQKLADAVASWWPKAVTDASLKALAQDMVMLGVAIARVHWALRERQWVITHLEHWHLSNVRWDNDRGRFVARTSVGEEVIEPNDSGWLVIAPAGERSWMAGAVRALGLPYVMRSFNWRDWAKYNERHGIPIIAVKEPSGFLKETKDGFYRSLKTIGSKGVLRLPQSANGEVGFDAQFLEPKSDSHKSFNQFRMDLDAAIAIYLLGQNLTTEVSGGSFAAANVHGRVRNDYLAADAEGLSSPLRDQLIKPWCAYNVASVDPELVPWPQWDTSLPEDLASGAATLKAFGDAVTALESAGLPIDGDELATRFQVPLRKGEKYEKPEPEKAALTTKPPAKPPAKATASLASTVPGYVTAQLYVDDVTDDSRGKAGAELASGFLSELLEVVQSSGDYETMRFAIRRKWGAAKSPTELRSILTKAMVLADLAGRSAVLQDAT
jgi:phage gp29-like protein